ncbi:glycosyltransferase family 4 protein [uncultured Fusobacterium sp.]|uniref:glycosyltransferase family 4 protein n=1 Tax=uncultured Fusobacterium sp. TaxID=159267 RepID=UPI0025F1514A|nr:glycosyltransferase family 4 protein [uncultured Fusobacterium sp.]
MKKKVLYFMNADFFGGVSKVIQNICKGLSTNQEIEIFLIVNKNLKNHYTDIKSINIYTFEFTSKIKLFFYMKKIIEKNEIEIIHSHDNMTSLLSLIYKKIFNKKIKIISHIHACNEWLIKYNFKKIIDKIVRNKYDLNIFCGKNVRKFYLENASYLNKEKTIILSNSVYLPQKNIIKNEIKNIYGYVGRLSEEKGIFDLIKEIQKNINLFKSKKFYIIGSGPQEKEIKEYVKKYDMEKNFIFLGFKAEVEYFYENMDVLMIPSHTEALPMVLLEAMAHGVIVLSMDVGSIGEVIINQKNGFLIKKGNYKEFIERLLMLGNEGETKYIRENAYKTVKINYNYDLYLKKLIEIYKII